MSTFQEKKNKMCGNTENILQTNDTDRKLNYLYFMLLEDAQGYKLYTGNGDGV